MRKIDFLRPVNIDGKVRLGPGRDGGYIVYGRLLKETDALVSYGVGWEIAFEEHFHVLTGKKVLMFDPTMFGRYLVDFHVLHRYLLKIRIWGTIKYLYSVIRVWQKKRKLSTKKIYFINEGIASRPSEKYDTFANHVQRFALQDKRILLKIDIEGGEYELFKEGSLYNHLDKVNQLIIEVHDLKNRLDEIKAFVMTLRKDFVLVHIHGNTYGDLFSIFDVPGDGVSELRVPDVLECLFVRREKLCETDIVGAGVNYPIPFLDYPNDPAKKDYVIDFI